MAKTWAGLPARADGSGLDRAAGAMADAQDRDLVPGDREEDAIDAATLPVEQEPDLPAQQLGLFLGHRAAPREVGELGQGLLQPGIPPGRSLGRSLGEPPERLDRIGPGGRLDDDAEAH